MFKKDCTTEQWQEFITAMHSGERFQVDRDMWYYWLEVLPPILMNEDITFLPGYEGHPMFVNFGFAEGTEPITVFWTNADNTKYFGQRTKKINPWA
ncbi:MAG: DUF1419 domain-containing protein [Planctomycetes bacterium]|nr:DUF1419 domain-containing protein [Planctomycetota bacterium]